MRRLGSTLLLVSAALSSVTTLAQAETAATPAGDVKVTDSGSGTVVLRKVNGEQRARLIYSYDGKAPTRVEGSKDGDHWKFPIAERVPSTAVVTLEFQLFKPFSKADADAALQGAADAIAKVLSEGMTGASKAAAGVSSEARQTVLDSTLGALTRDKLASALKAKLGDYELDGTPATEKLLTGLGFRQLGPDTWEPTHETFELLRPYYNKSAQRLDALQQTLKNPPQSWPACAGDSKLLVKGDAAKAARQKAALDCLKVFAESSKAALGVAKNSAGAALLTDERTKQADGLSTLAATKDSKVFGEAKDLKDGVGAGLAPDVQAAGNALIKALISAAKLPTPDTFTAKRDEANAAYGALSYIAALELEPAAEAIVTKNTAENIKKLVNDHYTEALVATKLSKTDYASELFIVDKPKPRFFISTGVMAAAFQDNWELALPVIASICVTSSGCETKGNGSGGSEGNYFSLDLGVKTVHLGGEDRREGAPSLLLGFGATPFFATHVSLGLNIFPNRQSDTPRANAAVYLAVTLDTVNGGDILGALGMGKPEVKQVGK